MSLDALSKLACQYLKLAEQVQVENPELFDRLKIFLKRDISPENYMDWLERVPGDLSGGYFTGKINTDYLKMFLEAPKRDNSDPDKEYFIFKHPNNIFPKNMKLKQEILLPPVGVIPKLYAYVLSTIDEFVDIDPQINPNYLFLTLFLKEFDSEYSPQEINTVITDNKNKLDHIIKFFEYAPKMLGRGVDGMAFDVGHNRVLKLFFSPFAFEKSLQAQQTLFNKSPEAHTEAMIYDLGQLKNKNESIYYYIMEKMEPINLNLRNQIKQEKDPDKKKDLQNKAKRSQKAIFTIMNVAFAFYGNHLTTFNKIKPWAMFPHKHDKFKNELQTLVRYLLMQKDDLLSELKQEFENENPDLQPDWLEKFIEEVFVKLMTGRDDLHSGNLGINKQRYVRYFDSTDPRKG